MDPKENLEKTIGELTAEEVAVSTPQSAISAEGFVAEAPSVETVAVTTTEVAAPVVAEPAKNDVVFSGKSQKKGKGMVLGMILLALIAAGGIGFGVWAWMDKDQQVKNLDSQIATLRKQNSDLQEQVTGLELLLEQAENNNTQSEVDCLVTPEADVCNETVIEDEQTNDSTVDDVTTDDTTTNDTVTSDTTTDSNAADTNTAE